MRQCDLIIISRSPHPKSAKPHRRVHPESAKLYRRVHRARLMIYFIHLLILIKILLIPESLINQVAAGADELHMKRHMTHRVGRTAQTGIKYPNTVFNPVENALA